VSELSAPSAGASVEGPVHDDAKSDAPTDTQSEKVTGRVSIPGPLLRDGQSIDVIVNPDGKSKAKTDRFSESYVVPLEQM
jgi:hypothetical protein